MSWEDEALETRQKEQHYAKMAERLLPKVKKESESTTKPVVCPKCKEPAKSAIKLCGLCQKDHDFSTHCNRIAKKSR